MLYERSESFDEARRLQALHALHILDTPTEQAFDALTAMAARLFDVPVALVTLVDAERQWIKASTGFDGTETHRDDSFCDHTIRNERLMVVTDATADPRFTGNPLVTGEVRIRFYAGVPLHAPDQYGVSQRVGALCAIDRVPRAFNAEQEDTLRQLGALADALLAAGRLSSEALALADHARGQAEALRRSDSTFRQAEQMAAIGSWTYSADTRDIAWSDGVFRIHELPLGQMPGLDAALDFYPPRQRETVSRALAEAVADGTAFSIESDFITAKGNLRRVRSMGTAELRDGRPAIITGVFQDITNRYEAEQSLRRLATTDELTRIANRAAFNRTLQDAVTEAGAGGEALLLVLIDLDHFKQINDRLGHGAGDDVLRAIGARLRLLAGAGLAARLGGDEFALILRGDNNVEDAEPLVGRLLSALAVPMESAGETITPSATIGYASFDPGYHQTTRDLVHAADSALYEAKRAGRGQAHRWTPYGRRADDEAPR